MVRIILGCITLTGVPAKEIKRTQLGSLDPGTEAGVAVLRVDRGQFGFVAE